MEKGRSPNTLAAYRRDLVAYEAWLRHGARERSPRPSATVTETTVAEYVAHLRAAGLAPASVARAMVAVRSLHRFMVQEGDAASDPSADLSPPPVPQGLPKALSEDEVGSLLSSVTGEGRPSVGTGPCSSSFTPPG